MNTDFPPTASSYPPLSFIRIGKTANLNGTTYRVVGRVRSETITVQEWDWEDSVYAKEPNYITDEWILQDSAGRQVYLSEYADKEWDFVVSQIAERADKQIPIKRPSMSVFGGLSKEGVLEKGESTVLFVEGENPDGEMIGEEFFFTDFRENGKLYSCEWENKDDGTLENIWFFEDHEWTREQIMRAFGETEMAKSVQSKAAIKKEYALWGKVFVWLFWAGFAACFIFFYLHAGQNVYSQARRGYDLESGVVFGPIKLDDKGAVYDFVIKSNYGADGSNEILLRLLDTDDEILGEVDGEHWQESGRDSEGPWTEGNYETRYLFRLQQPGSYRVQVLAKPAIPDYTYLQLNVYKNPILLRYIIFSTLLFAIAYLYFLMKRRTL